MNKFDCVEMKRPNTEKDNTSSSSCCEVTMEKVSKKLKGSDSIIISSSDENTTVLPDPKTSKCDPDEYLQELLLAMGLKEPLQVKRAMKLPKSFFTEITDEQMSRYNVDVVAMARTNNLNGIKELYEKHGKNILLCYNRFGEGLLNIACRRGYTEMVDYLINTVQLPIRIKDDGGRTVLIDTCWNPQPQLQIASYIIQNDPTLFLIADQRGYTPFQYARPNDYCIWKQFLYNNKQYLLPLIQDETLHQYFSNKESSLLS